MRRLCSGASVAALAALSAALGSPVQAQQASAGAQAATVEEVIVTATRRAQSLQEVPIAVTAFSETALKDAGVEEMQDLTAPNFIFPQTYTTSRSYISVRGVFQEINNMGFEGGFSSYLDGVYMGRNMSYNADSGDIERVEVLRGPQGTLFGKNTIAGVMNIVSKKPGPEFGGRLEAQVGNWDLFRVRGGLNVPLVEGVLAARVSVHSADRDGYVENVTGGGPKGGGIDLKSGRAQLLFTPNDRFSLHGSIDYLDSANVGYTWENETLGAGGDLKAYTNHSNVVPLETKRDFGVAVTGEYEFGDGFKFTSITGYRKSKTRWLEDEDGTPDDYFSSDNRDQQELWSQEFRINSPAGRRYDYVLGLYYFDQDGTYDFRIPFGTISGGPFSVLYRGLVETTSYAAFAHANFHVTDDLNLFGGIRYTNEEKTFVGDRLVVGGRYENPNFINPPTRQFVSGVDAEEISWTAGVQYDVADDVMIYASVANGFKSGGFNTRNGVPVKPEYLTSYEVGLKSSLFDRRMVLNVAAFYSDYEDLQVRSLDAVSLVSTLHNAANVTAKGFEVEVVAKPTERLSLNLGLGYVDSTFDEFKNTTNISGAIIDASGNDLPMTPPWTFNAGAQYEHPLPSGATLVAQADYTYLDERFGITDAGQNGPGFALDSYGLLNARLGYRAPEDQWQVFVWAKNLTDEVTEVDRRPLPLTATRTVQFSTYNEPRTYGVTLSATF